MCVLVLFVWVMRVLRGYEVLVRGYPSASICQSRSIWRVSIDVGVTIVCQRTQKKEERSSCRAKNAKDKWRRQVSILLPSECKSDALPVRHIPKIRCSVMWFGIDNLFCPSSQFIE